MLSDPASTVFRLHELITDRNIEHLDLEQAISRLPSGYRQVLVLHDIEDYTHQEIGRLLGITDGTSRVSYSTHARLSVNIYGSIPQSKKEALMSKRNKADDPTVSEKQAFARLSREKTPPDSLEDATLGALRDKGLIEFSAAIRRALPAETGMGYRGCAAFLCAGLWAW